MNNRHPFVRSGDDEDLFAPENYLGEQPSTAEMVINAVLVILSITATACILGLVAQL